MSDLPHRWFDGHLDLAFLELHGRDMGEADLERCPGDFRPAAATLPALRKGGVTHCLATIFTAPDLMSPGGVESPASYGTADVVEGARRCGIRQLEVYERWEARGSVRRTAGWADEAKAGGGLNVALLMEGADPIRDVDDAAWWVERGVRVVGLAWAKGTRYAGGNANHGPLTAAGRELVGALNRLGVVLDLSHLSDAGAWEVLERAEKPPIASHSNCRHLMGGENERHLSDELIRAIAKRGGVIGLNLFSKFLTMEARRATMAETLAHIDHICMVTGSREYIALGSDMDGGFAADQLPEGINEPSDLEQIALALERDLHWSKAEIDQFRFSTWADYFARQFGK